MSRTIIDYRRGWEGFNKPEYARGRSGSCVQGICRESFKDPQRGRRSGQPFSIFFSSLAYFNTESCVAYGFELLVGHYDASVEEHWGTILFRLGRTANAMTSTSNPVISCTVRIAGGAKIFTQDRPENCGKHVDYMIDSSLKPKNL